MKDGETPKDAVERLIKTDMPSLTEALSLTHATQEVQTSQSKEFNLSSRYFKKIQYAHFDEDFSSSFDEVELPCWEHPAKMEQSIKPRSSVRKHASHGHEGNDASSGSHDAAVQKVLAIQTRDRNMEVDKIFAWVDDEAVGRMTSPSYTEELAAWLRNLESNWIRRADEAQEHWASEQDYAKNKSGSRLSERIRRMSESLSLQATAPEVDHLDSEDANVESEEEDQGYTWY